MSTKSHLAGIGSVLSQDASLADIAKRAKALEQLDVELRAVLPEATAAKCRVLNVRDGLLVVMARSPVFAARVRLAQAELLARATELGLQVSSVVTRVGGWDLPEEPATVGKRLSESAAKELEKTAEELGDSDPLAQALRDLAAAARGRQRSTS
jgi:hypothetical protein